MSAAVNADTWRIHNRFLGLAANVPTISTRTRGNDVVQRMDACPQRLLRQHGYKPGRHPSMPGQTATALLVETQAPGSQSLRIDCYRWEMDNIEVHWVPAVYEGAESNLYEYLIHLCRSKRGPLPKRVRFQLHVPTGSYFEWATVPDLPSEIDEFHSGDFFSNDRVDRRAPDSGGRPFSGVVPDTDRWQYGAVIVPSRLDPVSVSFTPAPELQRIGWGPEGFQGEAAWIPRTGQFECIVYSANGREYRVRLNRGQHPPGVYSAWQPATGRG